MKSSISSIMKSPLYLIASVSLSCLAGIFSIIALWNNNIGEVQADYVLQILLMTFIINLIIFGFWLLITRSPSKTALLSIATYIFFILLVSIYNIIGNQVILGVEIGFVKLFALWTLLFILVSFFIFRIQQVDFSLLVGLNFAVLALLLVNIIPVFSFEFQADPSNKQRTGNLGSD